MNRFTDESEEVQFNEPIMAQKQVRMKIGFVERTEWEVKLKKDWTPTQITAMQDYIGQKFTATKLTLQIDDSSVKCEHQDAKPRMTVEDQFNIEGYPYPDKNEERVKKLGRQKLYQLEAAFGFEPCFHVAGVKVDPYVTKNGNKVAPKVEGVKRVINPDFFNAYYTSDGDPIVDNWVDKVLYADVILEKSEQFGDKNSIKNYVKAPAI